MSIKLRFVFLFVFIIPFLHAGEDESLFVPIQSYLSLYRQFIDKEDIILTNGVIYLELYGRRTNHKSLLLLGFYSVGRALQRSNAPLYKVQIIIHYELKDAQQIVASATRQSVLLLYQGQMNPEQFFSEVEY